MLVGMEVSAPPPARTRARGHCGVVTPLDSPVAPVVPVGRTSLSDTVVRCGSLPMLGPPA